MEGIPLLSERQAFLNAPEIKITKPSDTRWLARERCVQAVRQSLPALVSTFNNIYEESGDAEAFGVTQLLCTYKFVACLYMLCDEKVSFLSKVYRPYIQSVIDHISNRMESCDIFSAFSIFDPVHIPDSEESLSLYGLEKLCTLTTFYGSEQKVFFEGSTGLSTPDVDPEQAEAEWKIFRRIIYTEYRSEKKRGFQKVVTSFLTNNTLVAGFPTLARLATIAMILPVSTATVERSFSNMKLIKTRLRNRLGDETLDQAMRVSVEGKSKLTAEDLDDIIITILEATKKP